MTMAVENRLVSLDHQHSQALRETDHAITITFDLATIFYNMEDYRTAARFLSSGLELKQKILGSRTHPDLFHPVETLAWAYFKVGDWEKVEECSEYVLYLLSSVV